jgi:protein-S-isoprenylcysteine O-methyltransferase Ste14
MTSARIGPVATVALVCFALYGLLAFGLRTLIQLRRTGSSGFKGISGRPGSTEWIGGVLFVVAIALGVAAPVLALLDLVEPIAALDGAGAHVAGAVLFAAGLALTLAAQLRMGSSWRIGVDTSERTELVTGGLFALVRNPIFTGMFPVSAGLALMVPNVPALAAVAALVVALEIQTRLIEEPYLLATHGESYRAYAARVGRFVPGLGKLRPR